MSAATYPVFCNCCTEQRPARQSDSINGASFAVASIIYQRLGRNGVRLCSRNPLKGATLPTRLQGFFPLFPAPARTGVTDKGSGQKGRRTGGPHRRSDQSRGRCESEHDGLARSRNRLGDAQPDEEAPGCGRRALYAPTPLLREALRRLHGRSSRRSRAFSAPEHRGRIRATYYESEKARTRTPSSCADRLGFNRKLL